MTIVVDTTVIIDVLRSHDPARRFLRRLETLPVCSEVTRIEVMRGLRSHERSPAERLFDRLDFIDVDEGIARLAGELGRRWRASHPGIGTSDLAIAATAERLDAEVATANVKHFPMFPGLERPY